MIFIMLNMLTMAIEFEGMSEEYQKGLDAVNIAFLTIFTLECVIKIFGLRQYYFKEPWNVFDFVVVVVSLLSKLNRHFLSIVLRQMAAGLGFTQTPFRGKYPPPLYNYKFPL